jgi:hypothetical protein
MLLSFEGLAGLIVNQVGEIHLRKCRSLIVAYLELLAAFDCL